MKIVEYKQQTWVINFIGSPRNLVVEYTVERDPLSLKILRVWFLGIDITDSISEEDLNYLSLQCHVREV